ncbi:16S rRNA (uracil(1498)-N(3))-methyltransferase [Mycetohabitans endofungorum]|uniref:16S rRNA (uracil(1498)-N(3))-methyltransferase n=1 Tax=Mycetohabitans endofungorum TaxID=417203 RepID=UPI002B056026|nr:16S rRNA (uracil(1498)-N(3))-methyltransferase [Mycetohabitans endofungorum]
MTTLSSPRFFVPMPLHSGHSTPLPDDVVRHMHVLRLQAGDKAILFNGEGGQFEAELLQLDKRSATVQVGRFDAREVEPPYRVVLAQGIAGGDKMDWLLEKAVELGVAGVIPLMTARSVVRLTGERAARRHAHWQALVRAACEQCGRNRLPDVAPLTDVMTWLESCAAPPRDNALRLLLSPRAERPFATLPDTAPAAPVIVMIGPEGGLSATEEAAAISHGFMPLGLGPRVLRTETAGIAVLAALAARWGGW